MLCCRATKNYDYKGTVYVEKALSLLKSEKPVYLLTLNDKGALEKLRGRYQLIEFGWVEDQKRIAQILSASDLFLMPSIAESFGMMAVESMACGTPVVAFDGTALPDIIDAPRCGIVASYKDHVAFAAAIKTLLEHPEARKELSMSGVKRVESQYTLDLYLNRHLELYEQILLREEHRSRG